MDVSSVPSESKSSSSDFSIERLLRDDTRTQREDNQSPSWLCCTRYRPPRLPRPAANHGERSGRSRRSGRHARVPFTATQAAALETAYARAPYLAPPALRALAASLQLREDRIKIWFQNRRARERREKTGIIVPPHCVTLPPTAHHSQSTWISNKCARLPHASTELTQEIDSPHSFNNVKFDDETGDSQVFIQSRLSSFYNQYSTINDNVDKSSHDERPDTPLDIESIEE